MLEHNRKCLLIHPLLLTFLNLKWRNYAWLYIEIRASLLAVLAILLSILIATSDPPRYKDTLNGICMRTNDNVDRINAMVVVCWSLNVVLKDKEVLQQSPLLSTLHIIIIILSLQLISYIQWRKVVHWFHTFTELGTAASTAIFIVTNPEDRWLAAAVALLYAWVALNLISHYFDVFGLYTISCSMTYCSESQKY